MELLINWTSPSSGQLLNIYDHIEGLLKCWAGDIFYFFLCDGTTNCFQTENDYHLKKIKFLAKHLRQRLACRWTDGQEGDNYHGHLSSQQQLRLTEQDFNVYDHLRDNTAA